MFTLENTNGYTQLECNALNAEFERRFSAGEWGNADRHEAEQWFSDEVARRSVSIAAAMLGRKGGLSKSKAKKRSSRENGKLGGRPRKKSEKK